MGVDLNELVLFAGSGGGILGKSNNKMDIVITPLNLFRGFPAGSR